MVCHRVVGIPSSPNGNAYDIAAATISKDHSNKVQEFVCNYGRNWRFAYNKNNSVGLVYRENKKEFLKIT